MKEAQPIRYSVLDLATVTEGGSIADAFRRTVETARHAERLGYTRFWLAEHHNIEGIASAATAVLIGHVAGATSSIRVGSGGIMLPNHSALMVAEQFGTLQTLYPGRIDLGLGRAPGGDRMAAHALRRGLHSAEDDFPRQVQELLAYLEPAVPRQAVRAVPGQGTNVPVWLLGSSTYSAQLAAVLGLPFGFASHFAPEHLLDAVSIYRERFRPSASLAIPYVMLGVPLIAADTEAEARRLATTPYQRFLRLIRGEPIFNPPPVESMDGLWNPQEQALVEGKLTAAAIGDPETVRRKLAALVRATEADEFIFTSDTFDQAARLRSLEIGADVVNRGNWGD